MLGLGPQGFLSGKDVPVRGVMRQERLAEDLAKSLTLIAGNWQLFGVHPDSRAALAWSATL
jgi:hypothetical protein